MQENRFRAWLEKQEKKRGEGFLDSKSVYQYITDANGVEKIYGDLDELVKDRNRRSEVLQELEYAANTRKQDILPHDPNALFGGGYKTAVDRYLEFRDSHG